MLRVVMSVCTDGGSKAFGVVSGHDWSDVLRYLDDRYGKMKYQILWSQALSEEEYQKYAGLPVNSPDAVAEGEEI